MVCEEDPAESHDWDPADDAESSPSHPITLKQFDAWVMALKSGSYRQASDALKSVDPHDGHTVFCCLGVLRDITPGIVPVGGPNEDFLYGNSLSFDPIMLPTCLQIHLAEMNDKGSSFEEIAEWLEARKDDICPKS